MEGVLILDHCTCSLTTYVTFGFWIHWVPNLFITDAEFALRLDPNNQEIKKQYADAKSLYEKVSTSLFPVLLWLTIFNEHTLRSACIGLHGNISFELTVHNQ